MKKIVILLTVVLVGNALMNSCIYEKISEDAQGETPITPPSGEATQKSFYLRFQPGIMDTATVSTYVGPYIHNSQVELAWGKTESFGVFLKGGDGNFLYKNRKFNYVYPTEFYIDTVTTDQTSATGYGYIPYAVTVSGTNVRHTLNSVQDQSAEYSKETGMDEVLAENVFAISSPTTFKFPDNDMGNCALSFKSVFALLRFQVRTEYDKIFDHQKVSKVSLYVADTTDIEKPLAYDLAGTCDINILNVPGSQEYTGPDFGANGINVITANVTGGGYISESSGPYVWFVINPVKMKSKSHKLISIVETTGGHKIISKHDISEMEPNTAYFSTIAANDNNTVLNYTKELTNYDEKTSNSYIVSSAGVYRLYTKTISGMQLSGKSADWLWASKEGGSSSFDINELIDVSSIKYYENIGCIDFRVGSNLGNYTKSNVVLALKDASNNIVWTWHIWITDKPGNKMYDGGTVFLDRNIGALSADMSSPAIDTYGFVYQWGRKDPFYGGEGTTYDEANSVLYTARMHTIVNTSGTWNNANKWNFVNTTAGGNIDYSIKNPMSFVYNEGSGSLWENTPADWLSSSNSTLWGGASKTDYDPCPSGYRVPTLKEMDVLHAAYSNNSTLHYFKNEGGYWKYYSSGRNTVSYWPAAGMRQGRQSGSSILGAQLKYSGTDEGRCYYWTSTPLVSGSSLPDVEEGGTPLTVRAATVSGASYRVYTIDKLLYSADEYGDNADAYPVRCVKDVNNK